MTALGRTKRGACAALVAVAGMLSASHGVRAELADPVIEEPIRPLETGAAAVGIAPAQCGPEAMWALAATAGAMAFCGGSRRPRDE